MQCVNGSASQTSWTDQLDRPAGRTIWTDQLDGPWPWPVRIFEDFCFSLFIVAASESDEVLVYFIITVGQCYRHVYGPYKTLSGQNKTLKEPPLLCMLMLDFIFFR